MKRHALNLTSPGWALLLAALILSAVGVLTIHAAPPEAPDDADARQTLFIIGALGLSLLVLRVGYQPLGMIAYGLFAVTMLLLVVLVVAKATNGLPLVRATKGSYRWIALPGFKLQPSEIMKIAYIVGLAWYLRHKENVRNLHGLIGPFALTVLPILLVLLQPDFGTALLLMPVLFIMLFAAGARLRHLLAVILLAVLCMPVFWARMASYQRDRVAGLLLQYPAIRTSIETQGAESMWRWLCTPESARSWEQEQGYQLLGSLTALGSGGLYGKGWKQGTYVEYDFLPERHNDFIFAIIGEQFGFLGCLVVLTCYLAILFAGLEIANATSEPFGKLLAVGIVAMIFSQLVINVGMTMGLTPITGVTLPLVSYGGSSMVVNFLLIAVLISVSQNRPFSLARRPFEGMGAARASLG